MCPCSLKPRRKNAGVAWGAPISPRDVREGNQPPPSSLARNASKGYATQGVRPDKAFPA